MSGSETLSALASGLAVWPGLFLLAGGAVKAREWRAPDLDRDDVLARVLGDRVPLRPVWAAVAATEVVVGALVLAGLLTPFPALAAALVLGAAGMVAAWGVRNAPGAGCGCFGARSEQVSSRTVWRAAALTALALAGALGGGAWYDVLQAPLALVVVLAAGAALAAATPELRPRDVRMRAYQTVCSHKPASPQRTLERLRASALWSDAHEYLLADTPHEQWRDGCWRYLTYPAHYDGEPATAVFALYLGRSRNADGVAFVAEGEERVLGQIKGRK